jgi:hypothetical protein
MPLFKQQSFSYHGRSLEVRAELMVHAWHIGVYEDGQPLIGGIARCSRKDIESAHRKLGINLVDQVMLQVRDKVERGELSLP